jgi:hypothetical protein
VIILCLGSDVALSMAKVSLNSTGKNRSHEGPAGVDLEGLPFNLCLLVTFAEFGVLNRV